VKPRTLGRGGPLVGPIGLGCMGMSEFYGVARESQAVGAIERALELGVTLFDTADMYGLGENERLLGRALRGRRDEVTIATKVGQLRSADGAFVGIDGRPEYLRAACDASLERLGIETIDLLQLHRVDPATPIEESVGGMHELVTEGKVRLLGLSECTAGELRRAAGAAPIATLQSEYSVLERSVEDEILPCCTDLGVSFMPFAPLMRGLIARRFRVADDLDPSDARRQGRYPRLSGEALDRNGALASVVWHVADARGASPAQVALAWLLGRGPSLVPIPGAARPEHVADNVGAAALELSPAEMAELDGIVGPSGSAFGERLPPR
jgi:aryl-alcohol dehydrogenase-like predicted oxidoreductase